MVYQRDEQGEKHVRAGTYVLRAEGAPAHPTVALHPRETQYVAFQVASYDANKPLIIDPVLSWASYLGGSSWDFTSGIAVDPAKNVYVIGGTESSNFPGTAGSPIQSTFSGNRDVSVTKLNAAGTAIVYSTYLGGSGFDDGNGIAVDVAGHAYVTGGTASSDFPGIADNVLQSTKSSGFDAFVTKLNAAGTAIVYSTYLGGSEHDEGLGIAADSAGNAYITGATNAPGSSFPGTAGSLIQNVFGGGQDDAFVTKINAGGTTIVYSTYLGGSGSEVGSGIAVDAAANAYVTGSTGSSGFPSTGGSRIQSTLRGPSDGFVAKITSSISFASFDARAQNRPQ